MPQSRMATPLDMIEAHLTWMRAGSFSTNTVRDARGVLLRIHRDLPEGIHGALGEELADWLAAGPWCAQTRSTYYKHIVRFYRWAVAGTNPWLSYDPSVDLHRPDAKPGLPRPAADLVAHAAIHELPEPWRLACRLTALAGLRPCEVAILRREDVTEQNITIRGKGGKTRAVPTHPLIWQTVYSRPAGPLIARPGGAPADATYISRGGARALRAAGYDVTLYSLRHWFGTWVQRAYKDLRVTQELMGHATPVTTAVYTQVTGEQKRAAIDALPVSSPAGSPAAPGAPAAASAGDARPRPPRSEVSGSGVARLVTRRRLSRRVRP